MTIGSTLKKIYHGLEVWQIAFSSLKRSTCTNCYLHMGWQILLRSLVPWMQMPSFPRMMIPAWLILLNTNSWLVHCYISPTLVRTFHVPWVFLASSPLHLSGLIDKLHWGFFGIFVAHHNLASPTLVVPTWWASLMLIGPVVSILVGLLSDTVFYLVQA